MVASNKQRGKHNNSAHNPFAHNPKSRTQGSQRALSEPPIYKRPRTQMQIVTRMNMLLIRVIVTVWQQQMKLTHMLSCFSLYIKTPPSKYIPLAQNIS